MTDRVWTLAKFAMGFTLGLAVAVLLLVMTLGAPQPKAVEFIATNYEVGAFCPGDEIPYTLHLRVNRDESHLYVSSSILRGLDASGDTVLLGRVEDAVTTGIPTARDIVDTDPLFVVPALPPGEYSRVITVGTLSEDSKPTMRLMPFTVRDDCGN